MAVAATRIEPGGCHFHPGALTACTPVIRGAMGGIDVIDPRYRVLFERVNQVLGADHRVRSVVVGGSAGAGTADQWSDLDLIVVTEPDYHDEFISDWPSWLGRITRTVFARTPIARYIINTITSEGLTLDFVIRSGEIPAFR